MTSPLPRVERPRSGRILFGVCRGFARHLRARTWLVRAIWALTVVVTVGLSAVAYLILARVMPCEEGEGDLEL